MFDINELKEAETLEEALKLLNENNNFKIICGGTDILIKLRHGKMESVNLLSIRNIDCLKGIKLLEDNTISIGAVTNFSEIFRNEIINENIKWLEKNSNIEDINKIENIILKNNDSIKNMLSLNDGEYSATINYITAEANQNDRGSYIIRNTKLSPTYYYIKLIYEFSKWKIESIDKLPINN